MNSYKVVIVDDEPIYIEILKKVIDVHCNNLELVGVAHSIEIAIEKIEVNQPDIVFFDVNIMNREIFEIFTHFTNPDFKIIFVSANRNNYSKCLEIHSSEFVLKPFHIDGIIDAVFNVTEGIKCKAKTINKC
jgi:two-component system LytT family response regulator